MHKDCLGAVAALLTGAGLGLAQPAPAPPVLATPAPHVQARAVTVGLPTELPPLSDGTPMTPSDPGLFPFPGTGVYGPPDSPSELPPYCESPRPGPRKKRNDRDDDPRCHLWASGEPVLWWLRPGNLPPLAATGGGLLGGANSLDYGMLVGGRVAAGVVSASGDLGLEGSGLLVGRGATNLALPVGSGALAVASSAQLWGAEANLSGSACGNDWLGIDVLGGFRYLTLEESLALTQAGALPAGPDGSAAGFGVADSLRTRNQFFGGQIGSQVELRWGRLYTNVLGKVALGAVHQVVDVRGSSTLVAGLAPLPPGLLATVGGGRPSNDEFAVLPEVGVNVGYQFRPGLRVYAGYSFLYLNDVVHPGDQVNGTLNPAQLPAGFFPGTPGGPAQATPGLSRSDFWAQGVNIGLALRY